MEKNKMNKKTKLLFNIIFFMSLVLLTGYIVLKDQNIFEIFGIISSAKVEFLLIGVLCMLLYM